VRLRLTLLIALIVVAALWSLVKLVVTSLVLVEILDRMAERKAAPVIGAMRPERARLGAAELARHRARRTAAD